MDWSEFEWEPHPANEKQIHGVAPDGSKLTFTIDCHTRFQPEEHAELTERIAAALNASRGKQKRVTNLL